MSETITRLNDIGPLKRGKHKATPAEHIHRRPLKRDFEGKTVKRFQRTADNIWRIWFTDGTAFAIQSELFSGLPCMEICDECAR